MRVHLSMCFLRHLPESSAFEALAHVRSRVFRSPGGRCKCGTEGGGLKLYKHLILGSAFEAPAIVSVGCWEARPSTPDLPHLTGVGLNSSMV